MSRLAVPADATWIAPLWTEAAAEYKAFWPVRIPEKFDVPWIEANIAAKGHHIYVRDQQDGFFIVRPGYLPEIDAKAAELVIWIVKPARTVANYRATLRDVFLEWMNHEVELDEYKYSFGCMPANMPAKSLGWLEDFVANGGVQRSEPFIGPGNVPWYRYWGLTSEAVTKLPAAVLP